MSRISALAEIKQRFACAKLGGEALKEAGTPFGPEPLSAGLRRHGHDGEHKVSRRQIVGPFVVLRVEASVNRDVKGFGKCWTGRNHGQNGSGSSMTAAFSEGL